MNTALCAQFGPDWWEEASFLGLADREQKNDIDTAKRRINSRKRPLVTGQMVATLSFGFWVAILKPRYNPGLWSFQLRSAFPNLPLGKGRFDLDPAASRIAFLRNRIWHHEPIFRMDLSDEFRAVMELLDWICPAKASWVRSHCRVQAILRQKP